MRIGHGFDLHKFGGNGPIIIGGVKIPHQEGLIAHSDGDVALHALIDALLGAAALGDIGKIFPNNNDRYKDADSRYLLRRVYSLIIQKKLVVSNMDLTLIAQVPKLWPYISTMCKNIAEDLNCHIDDINIKATSTERLWFIGIKRGIACEAVVLLNTNTTLPLL